MSKVYQLFVYFDRFLKREIKLAVKEATEEVAARASESHAYHTRTGFLEREGVKTRYEDEGYVGVAYLDPRVPYAEAVHNGSRPHEILPKKRQALRWATGEGLGFWFAKRVFHPGYKGDPFLYNALDEMQADIQDIFDYRVERALKEAENAINS